MTFLRNIVYLRPRSSFAARARSARAANDTARAQINNIPEKSHFIVIQYTRATDIPVANELNKILNNASAVLCIQRF